MTSFANDFDPSMRAAAALGPKTRKPNRRNASARPSTSGTSGPTTTSSTPSERERPSSALGVVGADRVALGEGGDSRVSRGSMELGQERRLRELPRERVLTTPRSDDENAHRGSLRSTLRSRHAERGPQLVSRARARALARRPSRRASRARRVPPRRTDVRARGVRKLVLDRLLPPASTSNTGRQ